MRPCECPNPHCPHKHPPVPVCDASLLKTLCDTAETLKGAGEYLARIEAALRCGPCEHQSCPPARECGTVAAAARANLAAATELALRLQVLTARVGI